MTDDTQTRLASLTQSIAHHASVAGRKYRMTERVFHARQLHAKATEVLDILLKEQASGLKQDEPHP